MEECTEHCHLSWGCCDDSRCETGRRVMKRHLLACRCELDRLFLGGEICYLTSSSSSHHVTTCTVSKDLGPTTALPQRPEGEMRSCAALCPSAGNPPVPVPCDLVAGRIRCASWVARPRFLLARHEALRNNPSGAGRLCSPQCVTLKAQSPPWAVCNLLLCCSRDEYDTASGG